MKNDKYVGISTEDLVAGTIPNFDIYIRSNGKVILFRRKDLIFTEETLHKLIGNKIQTLFITEGDLTEFEKYCYNNSAAGSRDNVFDNPENIEKYYETHFNYYPIEKSTFIPGSKVSFNVYERTQVDANLFFGPDKQDGDLNNVPADIKEAPFQFLIHKQDIPLYKKYLQDTTLEYLKDNSIAPELQYSIIRENSKLIIKEILEDPNNGENIEKSRELVETLIDTILGNTDNSYNLMKITTYDYYTYTHSLNVCTLSIGIGQIILKLDHQNLRELGLGALLHDIGKCTIDPQLINKPGKLTPEEYKAVQNHVLEAKLILETQKNKIPQRSLYPILQHHEKLSGNGYPYKLKKDEIHLFGRLTGIVDFYDAVTTVRPYKEAYTPFQAFKLLSEVKEDYDQKLVRGLIVMLGNQAKAEQQKQLAMQQ